jgi:hypothetical protein
VELPTPGANAGKQNGRDFRLTDVYGTVIPELIA